MARQQHNLLLHVDELTWGFADSTSLLFDKFKFSLYKGDFTILMGKSGTGKTTFSKFLTGKLESPKKTIYYKMGDLSSFSSDDIQQYRRKLGLIFQDSKLIKSMTVKENVIYPLKIYGLGEATIEAKYDKIKKEFGLAELESRNISQLSGGEKQKINMARALIHDPELIIADEPTGNLDRDGTQKIADMLIKLHKSGKTVLVFTHDIHLLNYFKNNTKINLFKL
ncbi:MAG TPA: ATP-binding cassette domain-containing protein [Candidatus Absconditabacterales bacterium]|nr:ATP-binding cassette domain-containing protein [Candidatus Absconditabacterales bacterium]